MEGYFSYTLFGTQKELKKVDEKIKELAKTNKKFEELELWNCGIEETTDNETIIKLTYELPGSGNVSSLPFEFEEMMRDLSEIFKALEIEGTGYLIDYPPYDIWHSKKGESTYTSSYQAEQREVFIKTEDILDENNNFKTDMITCESEEGDFFDIPINKELINIEDILEYGYTEFCIDVESDYPEYQPDYEVTVKIADEEY